MHFAGLAAIKTDGLIYINQNRTGAPIATMPPRDFVLANENFTLHRTTPIFYQHSNMIDGPIASGTYFAIRKRAFLITAGHTITEFKLEAKNFLVPFRPKSSEYTDLGNCNLLIPDDDSYDVCALELLDNDKKQLLATGGWQFLSLKNVLDPARAKDFLLFGFPYAIKDQNKIIKAYHPMSAYADRTKAPGDYPKPLKRDLDLFFEYGPVSDNLAGEEVNPPPLSGASGASIWSLPTSRTVWMPPRVVGVQTSFFKDKYFRGIDWRVVAKLLSLADKELEDEILSHFANSVST
ncbi:MAG: hypothetical protein ACRECL_19485 [Bradyrhizobium sp.]